MDSLEQNLQNVLENISKQIAGTIGLSIVELDSGFALASLSNQKGFDLDIAAAYNAEVVKQKFKAMEALSLENQDISDMTITLTSQVHIIKIINSKYMMYFAVDSTSSNLAMTKIILNNSIGKIKELIETI